MRIRKKYISYMILLGAAASMLSGCGNKTAGENGDLNGSGYLPEAPALEQFDAGMSKAHFISAPDKENPENQSESADGNEAIIDENDIRDYEVSFSMNVQNTSACVVLGDKTGEYGELVLCEIYDNEGTDLDADGNVDGAIFSLQRFEDGIIDESFESRKAVFSSSPEHDYEVMFSVSGKELSATVNGADLGTWEIPGFSLGCVGTYKSRGIATAAVDNLLVKADGEVIFMDDFDGNFVNHLYDYNYSSQAKSAFSPYSIKTREENDNKSLMLYSGFVLSETEADSAPLFRKEFECDPKELDSAYLYMTALGSFDAYINGKRISADYFSPGKMIYDQYLEYVSYDVTDFITDNNTLDIALFHGFFDRGSGYPEVAKRWGKGAAVKGELVLVYKNGETKIIPTDESFKVYTDTRYRFDDIYNGEIIDERFKFLSEEKWSAAKVDDVKDSFLKAEIVKKEISPMRAVNKLDCVSVTEPEAGHYVYDFGQNIAGTISFNLSDFVKGELQEGQVITFRYGEYLNDADMADDDGVPGTIWTENLFTARATDYYIVGNPESEAGDYIGKESSAESISFDHTYHGFRYLEITGLSKKIEPQNIKAIVLATDIAEVGDFSCSSDIINRFYANSKNSMVSNFMDVPTDCSQRDERLGWSGDAHAASLFGLYQYDIKDFYENYLKLLRLQQGDDGSIADVVPFKEPFGGHNCWGDAAVIMTWNMYLQYGDVKFLEDNYDSLCKWVDYLVETSDDFLRKSNGYGDHLAGQGTVEELSDTAYCANSARLVSKMATVLKKDSDAAKYSDIADKFKDRWQKEYIREDGAVDVGILYSDVESDTAYSLGIMFDLFPENLADGARERLKLLADYSGYSFYPGYSGMSSFLPALGAGGNYETAVRVLENSQPGGLAYPMIVKGLTTNPEDINAFKPYDAYGNPYEDGKYRIYGSLNHAAYACACSFLFTDILGIKTDENAPGFEHFYIEPAYNCGLEYASGSYESKFGMIKVGWNVTEKSVEGEVPAGTTCTLTLPSGEKIELSAGSFNRKWDF